MIYKWSMFYNTITNNIIGFVAMDGFYKEPITKDTEDKFLDLPNNKFLLTPHNVYNSYDAVKEMERMLIESLTNIINGNAVRNNVK